MAHHSELAQFISAATVALDQAFTDGDEQGHKRAWERTIQSEHCDHALTHIQDALRWFFNNRQEADEAIDHAIFRLLAIKVLRLRQSMENK